MAEYAMRRLLYAAVTLLGITTAVFILVHAVPGDPVAYYSAEVGKPGGVPESVLQSIRHAHHLDQPILTQYGFWLRDVATLDFGRSFTDRRPVVRRIAERLPNTLVLNAAALLCALLVAIPIGILSAARPRGTLDRVSAAIFLMLYSLPSFWAALLLMDLFSVKLQVLPLYGMMSENYDALGLGARVADRLWHLVLPVTILAYGELALFARFSRSALMEALRQEYVTVARAKGAGEARVLFHHGLRNALVPLITVLGISIPYLLSGSVIVESIFAWDGLGRLYYDSVVSRDYPTVMALTVISAVATLAAYFVTDLLYSIVDPRIRLGEAAR